MCLGTKQVFRVRLSEQQSHRHTHACTCPRSSQVQARPAPRLCLEQEKHFVYALGPFTAQPAKEGNQLIPGSLAAVASSTDEVSISHPTDGCSEQRPTLPNGLLFSLLSDLLISAHICETDIRAINSVCSKSPIVYSYGIFLVCFLCM